MCVVDLPFKLPSKARKCYILPQLHPLLLSADQFCDSNNTVIFWDDTVFVLQNNHNILKALTNMINNTLPIITAKRDSTNSLCTITDTL